jgi:hypothetical protein
VATTLQTVVQAAYREGNLIAAGKLPTSTELTEAQDVLMRLILGILGFKMGENLSDWLVPQPQRTSPVSANYPQFPSYPLYMSSAVYQNPNPGGQMAIVQASGAGDTGTTGDVITLDGNGRYIQDPADSLFKTQVSFTFSSTSPFASQRWFYRDDLAQWMLVSNLVLANGMPYPPEFDDFFICALSKRLSPRYGKIVAKETVETALQAEMAFLARYRQPTDTVYGSDQFPRSYQSYISGNWWW